MWCLFLPFSSPPSPLCRTSGRRVYSKENLATGKSVFEDLTDSSTGAVHLPSHPSPQASRMLAQRTTRGDSQPPGLCQCRLCAHSGKEREGGGRKPEENREKEVLQKFYILHKASLEPWPPHGFSYPLNPCPPSLPSPGFQNIHQTPHHCIHSIYVLVTLLYECSLSPLYKAALSTDRVHYGALFITVTPHLV